MGKIWEKQWNDSWDMASILLLEGEANATKQITCRYNDHWLMGDPH